MTPERWGEVRRLFHVCVDLQAAQRSALLECECGSDAELRSEVQSLLDSAECNATFLERPAAEAGEASEPNVGRRVGPYQIVALLGEGGMASVWLAQRADGAFERQVALKLPRLRGLREHLTGRFARERDILAGLEHPNIARLYDAGVTPSGVPYLTMEYVRGQPIVAWCDEHRLDVPAKLKLFQQVLDAVQYAHERQVIHRDLKPSNILITEAGQVRLLDFGVAKLLEQPPAAELTRDYGLTLTPEYASPELVHGNAASAASDIYALGVVLYRLLTGAAPYQLQPDAALGLLRQTIATAPVARPSTRLQSEAGDERGTTQGRLARQLRGDLDAIVLKAMAKDPAERYRSASELSEDLRRYLVGRPVRARVLRLPYRLRKFVVRNRPALAAGAAVLALATAGYEVMRRELDRANVEAAATAAAVNPTTPISEKSIAVLPFADLSEQHDQEDLSDGLSEELIDRLSKIQDLKVIARTSSFKFKGKSDDARTIGARLHVANLLEGSVRKSGNELRVTVELVKADDSALLWSQTYDRNVDDVLKVQDDIYAKVTSALKVALNADAASSSGGPSVAAYRLLLKGDFYLRRRGDRGDIDKAVSLYREAIKLDPGYAMAWAKLGRALYEYADRGWKPREQAWNEGREAIRTALELAPGLPTAHRIQAEIYLHDNWNWAGALAEADRMHALGGADAWEEWMIRADIAHLSGNLDEAISDYRSVLDHDPLSPVMLNNLAMALSEAGNPQAALSTWRELVQLNPKLPGAYSGLSETLLLSGRTGEALEAAQKELDDVERHLQLANVYWALGRRAQSDAELKQLEAAADPYSWGIAEVYGFRSDKNAAMQWLERAYRTHDRELVQIKVEPYLRSLHGDPRYQALVAKVGLDGNAPASPTEDGRR